MRQVVCCWRNGGVRGGADYETQGRDEVIIRIEAAPISPSGLGVLLGLADVSSLEMTGGDKPDLIFTVLAGRLTGIRGSLGQSTRV
jgi:hypothetical protein